MMLADEAIKTVREHRACIDEIDAQIVLLLNERAAHSNAIQELKPHIQMGIYDPQREEAIYTHVEELNEGPLYNEQLRTVYCSILRVMKELRA